MGLDLTMLSFSATNLGHCCPRLYRLLQCNYADSVRPFPILPSFRYRVEAVAGPPHSPGIAFVGVDSLSISERPLDTIAGLCIDPRRMPGRCWPDSGHNSRRYGTLGQIRTDIARLFQLSTLAVLFAVVVLEFASNSVKQPLKQFVGGLNAFQKVEKQLMEQALARSH